VDADSAHGRCSRYGGNLQDTKFKNSEEGAYGGRVEGGWTAPMLRQTRDRRSPTAAAHRGGRSRGDVELFIRGNVTTWPVTEWEDLGFDGPMTERN
jgi:hypothetical protein